LFLTDTPLDKLVETYKAECAGMETKAPSYEDCGQLDYLRNCIFAAHGFAFEKKKWKKAFADKPWYQIKPEFKASMVSPLERATVTALNDQGKACKDGKNISAGDHARIKKWFDALPKVPDEMAKVLFIDTQKAKPAELIAALIEEIDPEKKAKSYALDKRASASYETSEYGESDVISNLKLPKDAKVRTVLVDFMSDTHGTEDNPLMEGTHVRFVFDDKDALLAIGVSHYLYD